MTKEQPRGSGSNLTIAKVGAASDKIVTNLFEYYLHDMAEWFQFDVNDDGRYSYDLSPHRQRGEEIFLARVGGALAGFALVGSAAKWLDDADSHDMEEFFVIRRYRRSGVGEAFATAVWEQTPGRWLVRVFERNLPAVPFWRTIIARYTNDTQLEERRVVRDNPWVFFTFDNSGA